MLLSLEINPRITFENNNVHGIVRAWQKWPVVNANDIKI